MESTRKFGEGTSVTQSFPWGGYVTATVLCPDNKVRKVKRISETADTFTTVPASVTVKGKTVAGYITIETLLGFSTTTEGDPDVVKFFPYKYRKNHALLKRELPT